MSNTPTSKKNELSFGVEVEFLFYFKVARLLNDELRDADASVSETPLPSSGQDEEHTPRFWATKVITEAIMSVPGAKMEGQAMPKDTPDRYRAMYLAGKGWDDHFGWTVKNDSSVRDDGIKVRGHDCLSFEVTSPALWDRPESHRHVYRVIDELVKRFRLRVNLRTGLHCHVGAGAQPVTERRRTDTPKPSGWSAERERELMMQFDKDDTCGRKQPPNSFKRAAALMWAADGFMCHAHPPERGFSYYAPPIRLCSRLAHGLGVRLVQDEFGATKPKEFPLDDNVEAPSRADILPKKKLPSYNFSRLDYTLFPATRHMELDDEARRRFSPVSDTGFIPVRVEQLPNRTVRSGVAHIMRCGARSEVADLLTPPEMSGFSSRPNYNLRSYLVPDYHGSMVIPSGTVEFREATGSVAAEWVMTWASICLAFFRFARDASEERYWAVIQELGRAEAQAQRRTPEGHGYDMISLLFDMGLFAEALFLESKLRSDPVRFWYPCRLANPPENGVC